MNAISYDLPIYALLREEGIETLHQASLRILSELGIDFHDDEVLAVFKANGASVEGQRVRLDPAIVEQYVAKAPSHFTQLARDADYNITIGNKNMVFAPVYGPPFVSDREGGRRQARLVDLENFVKLTCMCPYLHHSGGTIVEPTDIPVETRHLEILYSHIKYSNKPFMGSAMGSAKAMDSVAMAEILFGADAIRREPALLSLINVNSPRMYDERMLGALKVYARARQAVIITPFILAGSMGPVTVAGCVSLQNAEALAGIVLAQMLEPGTPVVYGSFLPMTDMRSGSPVFGAPESQLALSASAQLARRYGLPFRGGGALASSKVPDAQAAYESANTMSATVMAGTNFVLHAAGWLESGMVASYEKFVLDCEILGMVHAWTKGIDLSDESLAFESIGEVPPAGQFLATDHTLKHFREAFYMADSFDYTLYDSWKKTGSQGAYTRASSRVKKSLDQYEQPQLDPAIDEQLVLLTIQIFAPCANLYRAVNGSPLSEKR